MTDRAENVSTTNQESVTNLEEINLPETDPNETDGFNGKKSVNTCVEGYF